MGDDLHTPTSGHELLAASALAAILDSVGLVGDYNGNGGGDAADGTMWANNFNTTVNPFAGADGNGDGVIDAADCTVWADNLGTTSGIGATLTTPEPSSLMLFGIIGVGLAGRRRVVGQFE